MRGLIFLIHQQRRVIAVLLGGSLYRLDHILNDLLRVAEHHHGFVHVKEFVVQAGITRSHGAFVDDDGFGFGILQIAHIPRVSGTKLGQEFIPHRCYQFNQIIVC